MKDISILFGTNAGKVWNALNSNGSLTKIQLQNITKLSEDELFQAIGWLAKENKIKKEGEFYSLDQTNLKNNIDTEASKIFNIFKNGKINIHKLKNITSMNNMNFNLALGWLAREGKFENDVINDITESITNKIEIDELKNKIKSINSDLENRNLMINKLFNQISTNQYDSINDKNRINELNTEIDVKNNELLKQKNDINNKNIKIDKLKIELDNLNTDINSRNIIIKQVIEQLNMKQTRFIEKTNVIKNLEVELNKNKNLVKIANEKLNERINIISSLNEQLQNEKLDTNLTNSTLFSKADSLIKQKNEIINDSEKVDDLNEDVLINDSDKMDYSTTKKCYKTKTK